MAFRDKLKRVFHRSGSASSSDSNNSNNNSNNGKPKVEYYRRHEVPPSKFRGPFDKDQQKRLAAWSWERATAERQRDLVLYLSPCTTNDSPDSNHNVLPDGDSTALSDDSSRPTNAGSQSSTVVNSESYNGSMMTLLPETSIYEFSEDPIAQLKESIRYPSPIARALPPGKQQPFSPEDLTRALIAVQVCA